MRPSRREFLKGAAASATLASLPAAASAHEGRRRAITPDQIVDMFQPLPGDKALEVLVPAPDGSPRLLARLHEDSALFAASGIKTYVLCEALRQEDGPGVVHALEQRELPVDATTWSLGSPTFNPPDLSGTVSERTALEAMICRSDNTATDMILNHVGAENVRRFIASAGLTRTLIPESTRAFTGYVFGASDYLTLTWDRVLQVLQNPQAHPFLNEVQTLASSASDLVSYYSRALQGEFFRHAETLTEFRRILSLCDFISLVPLPLGVSAYVKSGNSDTEGFHARCVAGGMFFASQWVYFAFILNWFAAEAEDPDTVGRFFSAIHRALSAVKDAFAADDE